MFVFVVIVITATIAMAANACPQASRGSVFCQNRGLTAIPAGLDKSATVV